MLDTFLMWYFILSKSNTFKWAKFWLMLAGLAWLWLLWCWFSGNWGFLFISFIAFSLSLMTALEALSVAYYETKARRIVLNRYANSQQAVVAVTDNETDEEEDDELTDKSKLELCQFYTFLYLVFELHRTGEGTLGRMAGIPAGRYRLWMKTLAGAGLADTHLSFEEVLDYIAKKNNQDFMWNFTKRVYSDPQNWREYDPRLLDMGQGRKLRVGGRHVAAGVTTIPIYPTRLRDLKF